ncbi:MAG: carboxylating nicotinate-nucleotide diphosphorylase [Acidobacteriota bacterium]|nr:carboxylating nicotinate-nucleotide diphosphorylase [Acidobacteriota bacterium]
MSDVKFEPLVPLDYQGLVRQALDEDRGDGDITSEGCIPASTLARARILVKSECVLAGLDVAIDVFRQVDAATQVIQHRQDGCKCKVGEIVAEVTGLGLALLTAERTALNFLQRLSGIATLTRRFVDASGGRIVVLDTRKTTPTLRTLEKYAVRIGGGTNHRFCLNDRVLIKDSHVELAGGIESALQNIRSLKSDHSVEIEVQNLDQVDVALAAGVDILLLDNMSIDQIKEAVLRSRGRAAVEISGGVTLERMAALADTGAEYVSVGALTHSAPAVDMSVEMETLRS